MTVGRKQYNESDMLRMQRDAEARVRDMQNQAQQTLNDANGGGFPPPSRNRNWNMGPNAGMPRNNRGGGRQQQNSNGNHIGGHSSTSREPEPPPVEMPPAPPPVPEEPKKETTIVGDIMGALGLDEDYLLIIGLLLILINQRADTTLILALAYLLI